jgi:hypothetical protein
MNMPFAAAHESVPGPIAAPTLPGGRGGFRGHTFRACCDGSRQFMTRAIVHDPSAAKHQASVDMRLCPGRACAGYL